MWILLSSLVSEIWIKRFKVALSGIPSDIAYYGCYILIPFYFGPYYLTASLIGFVAYWIINFLFVRNWAFEKKGNGFRQALQHVTLHIACQAMSMVGIHILTQKWGWNYIIAQIPISVLYTCINVFVTEHIFHQKDSAA